MKTKLMYFITLLSGKKKENSSHKRILGGLEGKISDPENFNEPFKV